MSELDEYWRDCKGRCSIHLGKKFPVAPNDLPGYCKLRQVGSGGQGRVYRADSIADGQKVAIKFYAGKLANGGSDDECQNELQIRRFKAEAEILQKFEHPQLPRCLEVGDYYGRPYYVMEYLEPFSVRDVPVFDDGENDEPFAEFLLDLLDVVEYLHKRGIIHQDIKPKNICWKNGKPALIDLGLVYDKHMAAYTTEERLDILAKSSGGSPGFCAPEQYCGPQKNITKMADIFAIGNLINECLRGYWHFQYMLIADRCLNINPRRRFNSVSALRRAIMDRQRTSTIDVLHWGHCEVNRQIRIFNSGEDAPVHETFQDLVFRSLEWYNSVYTHGGVKFRQRGDKVVWWPLAVSGKHVIVDGSMHFGRPAVIHIIGYGTLEMTLTGRDDVVVVLDRGVQFINHARGDDADEVYFLNNGCGLSLPNVRSRKSWNARHRVYESLHNRPIVSIGTDIREDVIESARREWNQYVARHRALKEALDGVCDIDFGAPVLDVSFADFMAVLQKEGVERKT